MITTDSKKIIVVDDSQLYRAKMADILGDAGHKVTTLPDGADLKELLDGGSDLPDLVILDLQMPKMDGFKTLEWLNEANLIDKLSVICVTGAYDPEDVSNRLLKDLGASGLITKDFTPEQTVSCINEFMFQISNGNLREGRVVAYAPAEFTVYGEVYKGHLLNISNGGLFLQTTLNLPKGTFLMLKFLLPNMGSKPLCIKSEVQWSTPEDLNDSRFAGAGVKFTHFFRANYKEMISDYLKNNVFRSYTL